MKTIKKYINENNKTILIGLLTILVLLWFILYFIPELFISLFDTFLGNLILILITILVMSNNYIHGIIIGIFFIIFYRFLRLSKIEERFESNNLSDESINKFLRIQTTINKEKIFDIEKLKQQVTQKELDYFLNNGMWYWSDKVKSLYKAAVLKNVFVRSDANDSANYARTIYNQNAILELLSIQSKEGNFLLNGVEINKNNPNILEDLPSGFGMFGYKSGLISEKNDIIKCNIDPYGNNSKLEKIHYTGKGGIFNEQTKNISEIDYNNLESEIPGFKFMNGACNPCEIFNSPPNYSCKYELNVSNERNGISNIWKYLWNL